MRTTFIQCNVFWNRQTLSFPSRETPEASSKVEAHFSICRKITLSHTFPFGLSLPKMENGDNSIIENKTFLWLDLLK